MKLTIHREKGRQTFSFTAPQTLSELLRQAGVALPLPCGGQRRCGNCRVAAFGALRPPTAEEERLLGMPALLEGVRLACCAVAEGDCSVWVDPPREVSVQTAGKLRTSVPLRWRPTWWIYLGRWRNPRPPALPTPRLLGGRM